VLILARGGGSLEDLWAFNTEQVARAIFYSSIPIVTGVGHEIDFTIADLTADYRAATPTAAAEILSPDQQELHADIVQMQARLQSLIQDKLNAASQSLDWISSRLVHPKIRLENLRRQLGEIYKRLRIGILHSIQQQHLDFAPLESRLRHLSPIFQIKRDEIATKNLLKQLNQALVRAIEKHQANLRHLTTRLNTVNPTATLERGYAIVRSVPDRKLIRQTRKVSKGDQIEAQLADGNLNCSVDAVSE